MKIAILLSIARQVEGEMVFVKVVEAHENADKLYRYLRENDLPRTANMQGMNCIIEYGILEDIEINQN